MVFNISFDIASLCILICMLIVMINYYKIANFADKFFRIFVFALLLTDIVDITRVTLLTFFDNFSIITHYAIATFYLLISQTVAFFAFVYIIASINYNSIKIAICSSFVILLYIVALIINFFTKSLFYFENSKIVYGPLNVLTHFANAVFIFAGIIILILFRSKFTKKQIIINYIFIIIPIVAANLQILFSNYLLITFGGTMSAIIILFSLETPDEVKNMELEKKYIEDANKAKSQFFVSMSHEIRTPVNTIMGMNEIILREATEPAIRKYAMDVKYSANTLLSLVNDFLDISKMESGKMELIPVEYDFSELLYEIITMIKVKAEDKGLSFNINIQASLPRKFYGDNIRIRQILINLLTNAVKYTLHGSVSLIVNGITIDNETQLHFEIMDTGIGIKSENIKLLTENYTRIEENQIRSIEGTGLGLGIVKYLLNQMNSTLDVESIYGKGSIFSFTISQPVIDSSPIGNFMDKIKSSNQYYTYRIPFIAPTAKILLVDDNELNRKVFCQLLKNLQIKIVETDSGFKALEKVKSEKFDIIFLDHMMPEMDGIETMHKMHQQEENLNKDTPVIMLTANVVLDATKTYFDEGFKDYITKPISPEKLERLIKSYLPSEKVRKSNTINSIQNKMELDDYVDSLPQIEEFDWDYARKFYKNKDMLLFTLKNVCESLFNEAYHLESLYRKITEDKLLDDYRITVHALKSTMAMVGGLLLSKLARLCENAAIEKDFSKLEKLHPILIEEMFKHHDRLLIFTKTDNPNKIPYNKDNVLSILDSLEKSLQENNYNEADNLSEKLHLYEFDEDLNKYFKKLFNQIIQFETKASIELISQIKLQLNGVT